MKTVKQMKYLTQRRKFGKKFKQTLKLTKNAKLFGKQII